MENKKIGTHATSAVMRDGWFTVTYHNTEVFKYNPINNKVVLNTNFYFTATTKKRINKAFTYCGIPATLLQVQSKWIVNLITDSGISIIPFEGRFCCFNAKTGKRDKEI